MELVSTRDVFSTTFTLASLTVDGVHFGYVCEDRDRGDGAAKVPGQTAIPVGTYRLRLYDSPKHGPDTLELVDVPGFQHIQVHSGNTPADTLGCQLVGFVRDSQAGTVAQSRVAVAALRERVVPLLKSGVVVTYTVQRAPGAVLAS